MSRNNWQAPETSARGQLAGIRVLDLSRVLAGPLAAQVLADLGADVIKVERPGMGDESRQYGPPFLQEPEGEDRQQSAFYLSANRNKRSLTLDLSRAEGQSIARSLAAKADIVIENFRVGALARYGLDYATLSALNPGLIYCSITGYGQTGPYKDRPGYDAIFQAMSGLMSSIGHPDDAPGGGPMRTGPSIVDVITSLYADIAMLSALQGRAQRGGRGEYIDLALLDCGIAAMSHYAMSYLISGRVAPRRGNGGNGGVPSQVFTCSDGLLSLTAGNDAQFGRLCHVVGLPDLPHDPRFASGPARIQHRDVLIEQLSAIFAQKPVAIWLEALVQYDVPSGPVNDLAAVFSDPQVCHRGMSVTASRPTSPGPRLVANPIHYSERPVEAYRMPPRIGADTDSILADLLELDPAHIARLRADGVI